MLKQKLQNAVVLFILLCIYHSRVRITTLPFKMNNNSLRNFCSVRSVVKKIQQSK